ncbi:DNA helicase/exodeoxyribonuclease V beta subunit [Orbus hercynius]|uniref:RecBCD enzyme subunit RecB n=1 Tax=Orbus hercynius TaxID=593135 RepID=A0A495RDB2_9GAMM|nr:exodeoxyribonuclease V subunit beta [Orbus hercynius]RKS85204.1 DNA helicase/exodeoxyribonuclease V beta subunit [Orbus hercynius]
MASSLCLNQSDELNLFSLPLIGRSLIEASAGTGKTYSLAFIYLRLLLGIGQHGDLRPLSVDEILVVTFTKAATEELRYRIRQNIHQLRLACVQGYHQDDDYQQLIHLIEDKNQALKRLTYAEQSMDEAAIFTIHGFCQRILTTYAFEAGILFNQTLVKDESSLYLQVVSDFWRTYFTPLPEDIARMIWVYWADPNALLDDISLYLNQPLPDNIHVSSEPLGQRIELFHQQAISQIEAIKQQWLAAVADLAPIIVSSGVSKRSYSKANLPRWLDSVTCWAQLPTVDYAIVDELAKFSQAELDSKTDDNKMAPAHAIFLEIQQFLTQHFSLRDHILFDIVNMVAKLIDKQKQHLSQMGFNDLINHLHHALSTDKSNVLAEQIMRQYPAAMIDEFQDTDPIQYQIFNAIYRDRQQSCLLLIGDPKQAIYGFRGADIFTYIKAKSSVDHQFTMLTNWRSSESMVQAVNRLFSRKANPFIFEAIPFVPMKSAPKNHHKGLYVNQQEVAALQGYLLPPEITSSSEYFDSSAEYCAEQISTWLSQQAYFSDGHDLKPRPLQSADIAILVRTGREAEIIQQKLNKRNLKSIYVSNRKSVFETLEAREVLRILQAALSPTNESYVRSALATQLVGVSMAELDMLSDSQDRFETVIEEFKDYQAIWLRYGVLVMLRRLMNRRHLAENLLRYHDGERIITNFMHLGELLQEIAQDIDTPYGIIRWLTKQINEPDRNLDNHEQRLESDENLINIITIHKSKGLEYPIVFLPFIGSYRESDSVIYHDRQSYQVNYAYRLSPEIKALIEQERLAEDLRLLYVALTRSIYHCSFGLAGIKRGNSRELTLKHSAIGYLLSEPDENDYSALEKQVQQVTHIDNPIIALPVPLSSVKAKKHSASEHLAANRFKRQLDSSWRVTSYSGLLHSTHYDDNQATEFLLDRLPAFDSEVLQERIERDESLITIDSQSVIYDIHHFPKGAIVGTLLHECFENSDFTQPDSTAVAAQLITKLNLDEAWQAPLSDWFLGVLQAPLHDGLALADISLDQRLNEFQFYLPIRQDVSALQLDQLCKHYDPLSKRCDALSFTTVKGMLKGFIDLVFEWQGKYYIVDYKSNYLGCVEHEYQRKAIELAMCEHRYDLQYQLYSLALHRYLKSRISNYQYQTHFGGVYYLFIRGMGQSDSPHGIFYTKPEIKFIEQLDKLFG